MKNLSKVLAVVLALAMALSMVSFAAYTDVEAGADCEEAVTVLSALEILKGYEDGSFKPEATITRAEFATVVIRLLGLADTATGGATIFTDVAADHWANGYIALAAQQGIVNGYGDGRFGPEDPVKYQEAIKMVVAALGYTPMADANGGYPGGYQVVASQKGILAGISGAKANEPATRGVVAQLAYNSLTVPLMEQTGYGTQTNFQTVNSLLLNKLGVTKFEGVVTATSLSSNLKDGKIKVDYNYQITAVAGQGTAKKYAVPNVNTNPYVGSATPTIIATGEVEEAAKELIDVASVMYVKAADTDDAELLCILKDGNKNETVDFATEDLKANASLTAVPGDAGTDDDAVTGTIEVYTDKDAGETEEYILNINKVYVNGRETTVDDVLGASTAGTPINSDAQMEAVLEYYLKTSVAADVTLLSQAEDEFNVAYITVYKDVQVTRIADRTWKVSYKTLPGSSTDSVILDETSKTQKFEIYKDGEIASFEDIKEDDVLSIAGYINGSKVLEYGKVYIVSDKVEGKVTAKAAGKVSIDGTVYKTTATGFNLGDTAVFFKNYRGILVAVDTTATAANVKYGFATYIRKYDADYGEPAQIRLLNAEGKWETLDLADQVSIDGAARTASKGITWTGVTAGNGSALAAVMGGSTLVSGVVTGGTASSSKYGVNEVVAYDLNAAGQIAKLYLNDTASVFVDESISGGVYSADTFMIGDYFYDENTVIFNVPAGVKGARTLDTNESDVSIVALSSLADGDPYTVLAGYDEDDSGILGAALGQGMAAGINYADNFFVLTDAPMEATNEAGEAGILLEGIKAGEETTLFINTDEYEAIIKKAAYTTPSSTVDAQLGSALTPVTGTPSVGQYEFEMGDVLLYTLNAKGEAASIAILVEGSDIAKAVGTGTYTSLNTIDAYADDDTVLATITGNTNYKFVVGYAQKFLDNGNLSIYSEDTTAAVKTYAFANDAVGTLYDKYTGDGKVMEAMTADIATDSDASYTGADGDIVFARIVGNRIAEFVVIANSR